MGPFDRFGDRAKRVLALEGEGIAAGVLRSLGVTLERVRHQVIATLGQSSAPTGAGMVVERAPDPRGSLSDAEGKKRDWYCEDVLSGKLKVHVIHEDAPVLAFEHPYPEYIAHAVVIGPGLPPVKRRLGSPPA